MLNVALVSENVGILTSLGGLKVEFLWSFLLKMLMSDGVLVEIMCVFQL